MQWAVSYWNKPLHTVGSSEGGQKGRNYSAPTGHSPPSLAICWVLYLELDLLLLCTLGTTVTLMSPVQLVSWSSLCQTNLRSLARKWGSVGTHAHLLVKPVYQRATSYHCEQETQSLDHTLDGHNNDSNHEGDGDKPQSLVTSLLSCIQPFIFRGKANITHFTCRKSQTRLMPQGFSISYSGTVL